MKKQFSRFATFASRRSICAFSLAVCSLLMSAGISAADENCDSILITFQRNEDGSNKSEQISGSNVASFIMTDILDNTDLILSVARGSGSVFYKQKYGLRFGKEGAGAVLTIDLNPKYVSNLCAVEIKAAQYYVTSTNTPSSATLSVNDSEPIDIISPSSSTTVPIRFEFDPNKNVTQLKIATSNRAYLKYLTLYLSKSTSGIEDIVPDNDVEATYYDLNGNVVDIHGEIPTGIYIERRGDTSRKVLIRKD